MTMSLCRIGQRLAPHPNPIVAQAFEADFHQAMDARLGMGWKIRQIGALGERVGQRLFEVKCGREAKQALEGRTFDICVRRATGADVWLPVQVKTTRLIQDPKQCQGEVAQFSGIDAAQYKGGVMLFVVLDWWPDAAALRTDEQEQQKTNEAPHPVPPVCRRVQ
jgi:hypothetical protein